MVNGPQGNRDPATEAEKTAVHALGGPPAPDMHGLAWRMPASGHYAGTAIRLSSATTEIGVWSRRKTMPKSQLEDSHDAPARSVLAVLNLCFTSLSTDLSWDHGDVSSGSLGRPFDDEIHLFSVRRSAGPIVYCSPSLASTMAKNNKPPHISRGDRQPPRPPYGGAEVIERYTGTVVAAVIPQAT